MAQINITLEQTEILQLLEASSAETFRVLLEEALNSILKVESKEQLGANRYERTIERTDSRNGIRTRSLTTRIGTLVLRVPRHRNIPFKTLLFDNYKRSEAALVTAMAEMVVAGVSTAKVGRVMKELCGTSFSKQSVSEACKELDRDVEAFRLKRIDEKYLFVMVDATYIKVREDHRICAKALMVATGLTRDGRKEIVGFDVVGSETHESWCCFLQSLKSRGLTNMQMITSDANDGLVSALHEVYPDIAWQRCQAHFARNICEATPKRMRMGLRQELSELFNCKTIEEARCMRDEIIADYQEVAPKAMECLDTGFDDAMSVMVLPDQMRKCTRTTNYIERLNKEVKRRSNAIGIFPNTASVVRLVGAFLIEENDRWAQARKIYYQPACKELELAAPKLASVAKRQRLLAEAA